MTEEPMWKLRHEALSAPFPEAAVKTTQKKGGRYQYVTARTVMNRLDEVVGPGNWSARFEVADPQTGVVKCSLTVYGVTNEDFGDPNNVVKGEYRDGQIFKEASSDALKRAAVFFGVGRYLYEPDYEEDAPAKPAGQPASNLVDVSRAGATDPRPVPVTDQIRLMIRDLVRMSGRPYEECEKALIARAGVRMGTNLSNAALDELAPDAIDTVREETRKALEKAKKAVSA